MLANRIIQRESVVHRLLKIAVCFVVQLSIAQSNSAFPQVQNLPYEPHKMGIQYQIGDLDNITSTIYNGRGDGVLFPQESNPTTPVQISFYVGLEGSKQPQDFGANANVGGRFRANISGPLFEQHGIGYQIGTALVTSANGVQVFELLGAAEDRIQSFTTLGIFQRNDRGFSWGFVYDFLFQDSFDNFDLGQWRLRMAQFIGPDFEIGFTVNLKDHGDVGFFNATQVDIDPIQSYSLFARKYWESTTITTVWVGQSAGHREDNAIVGVQSLRENNLMVGSEFFAPLNNRLAIYGEANVVTPVDTGVIDAFLGVEFSTSHNAFALRNARFRRFLPVASSVSFVNDLRIR